MAKIITVKVSKGGVGKTTVTANLGHTLAKKGFKTLLIDFDSQSNLSKSFIKNFDEHKLTSSNLLGDEEISKDNLIYNVDKDLDIISSDIGLYEVSKYLENLPNYKTRLVEQLKKNKIFEEFEYILLDLSPGVADVITQISLVSSDLLICPCHFDIDSLTGLVHTISDISRLQEANILKNELNYLVVPNKYDLRFKKDNEHIISLLYDNLDKEFIAEPIRENSHIKKARMFGQSAIDYELDESRKNEHKKAIEDFEKLYEKIINILNN